MGNPAHAAEYSAISAVWEDFDSTDKLQSLAQAMERKKNESQASKTELHKLIGQSALGILLAITCGLLGYGTWNTWVSQPVFQMASNTGIGEIKHESLADGSVLTMNANSQVEITYYRNSRRVKLNKGEVVFDVSRDPSRPFIIDSGDARVTVLGTHFAVNRLSSLVRVSVKQGRVRVETQDADANSLFAPIVLRDGEVAEVFKGQPPRRIQRQAADAFMFQQGAIVFDWATLDEIAETLSRYHATPILADAHYAQHSHVTAVVQTSDIEGFLQSLPRIAPVQIQQMAGETRLFDIGAH